MRLIIFTGAPASGKSSIADEVGKRLGINVISKDENKIRLFEKYGFTNHDEKKKLSILGEKQLDEQVEECVRNDEDIIVDNNYKNFDSIRNLLKTNDPEGDTVVICIYCVADYEILAKRYNERILSGNRHLALYTLNQYPIIEGVSEFHPIIDKNDVDRIEQGVKEKTFGNNVLKVNTDDIENDFDLLCNKVIAYIEKIDLNLHF